MKRRIPHVLAAIALGSLAGVAHGGGDDSGRRHQPFVATLTLQLQGISIDAARCPDPAAPFRIDVSGTAKTTVGAAQFAQTHCENDAHTLFTNGTLTMTFADGSKLRAQVQGRLVAPPASSPADAVLMINGMYRNTGGTGAFAHAHGTGVYAGSVNLSDFSVITVMSGGL